MRDDITTQKETAGEQIRAWRESNGVTQAALAERLGISSKHLSGVESNDGRSVSLNVAIRIQRETGVPVEAWETNTASAADVAGLTGAGDVAPRAEAKEVA